MPSDGVKLLTACVWSLVVAPLLGWVLAWRVGLGRDWAALAGLTFAFPAVLAAAIGALLGWRARAALMVVAALIVSGFGLLASLALVARGGS